MELSMDSIDEINSTKTIKLRGNVGDREVAMFIENGASHNFVYLELVKRCKFRLSLLKVSGRWSEMDKASRGRDLQRSVVGNVRYLGDLKVFPFELGSGDVILGIKFLGTLGDVISNGKMRTMKFGWMGRRVKLQRDHSLTRMVVSLKVMLKTIREGGEWYVLG